MRPKILDLSRTVLLVLVILMVGVAASAVAQNVAGPGGDWPSRRTAPSAAPAPAAARPSLSHRPRRSLRVGSRLGGRLRHNRLLDRR